MSDATPALTTRNVDGVELPLPGTFTIDPSHTHVGFSVRHMMVSKVRGRFAAFTGAVTVADEHTLSSVEVEVDLASIDTRDEGRDTHLRSGDFFDVDVNPTMTFRSTSVSSLGKGRYAVQGELSVKGTTRPVELDVTFEGVARDPWGGERLGFSATGEINREDFGLTWNQSLEAGGVLVGKNVKLEIEAEAVRQS